MKFYFLIFLGLVGFNIGDQRKIISDDDYNYEFYVSLEKITNYRTDRSYYWFKSQEVHSSVGFSNGELLNGSYIKSSRDHKIIEHGNFNSGLKNDVWREWYDNGNIRSITYWKKGYKTGTFIEYSPDGKTILKGKYKKNKKHGYWINQELKDTLRYRNGILVEKKILDRKKTKTKTGLFLKKIFAKGENNTSQKSLDQSKIKQEPFFDKLFSRKEKPNNKMKKKVSKKREPKETKMTKL